MTTEERRQKKNQESLESYNWYKAHRICVRCHNTPAVNGLVTCQECRETMNENHRIRYAGLTPEQKAERSAKQKAVRETRRAAGLCPRCGREREDTNLLTCERCRRGDRERKCKD